MLSFGVLVGKYHLDYAFLRSGSIKKLSIKRIVSGGQTGADRGAFDFALANGLDFGGFVPRGRRAEDGGIPEKYTNLVETKTQNYSKRTRLNIINSDTTIIFSHGNLRGGSLLTKQLADELQKPVLHINFLKLSEEKAIRKVENFLLANGCEILNIAGPRASGDQQIYNKTREFLTNLFDQICW